MIPTPRGVQVALQYLAGTLEAYNIFNVRCPAAATSADLTAIATVFEAWWRNEWKPAHSNLVNAARMTLTALDGPGAPYLLYTPPAPVIAGTMGNPLYPPQVTVAVALRTGLSGRSYRGRVYTPFLSQTVALTNGLMTAANNTIIYNAYLALVTRLNTAGYPLCVLSLYSGVDGAGKKIARAAGILTPVTTIAVGLRADTQRRRLPVETRV